MSVKEIKNLFKAVENKKHLLILKCIIINIYSFICMTPDQLLIELNIKLNQNIIYTFDVYKDSVTIYGVEFSSKTIKLNKNIQEQFNQIFK